MNLLYIDDDLNSYVEDYLINVCNEQNITYQEYEFNPNEDSYETIIQKDEIKESDILIIDSMLFENDSSNRFTGEELTILIKKIFPFKVILIISKNSSADELYILPKYNSRNGGSPNDFFESYWKQSLESSIKEIYKYLKLKAKVDRNENIDVFFKNMIDQSFDGFTQYDNLKASDISACIQKFEEIKGLLLHE